jgi:transposase
VPLDAASSPHWARLANYFRYRVTSAVSEGINNVIKALKRRAYGYRNMEYFRLKILQQCGYLNSRHIPHPGLLG